ncbi:MAG: NAD-dependent protein deacylase [Coriobacteriales bacterium]|jgi:NAD-dependent deacetylase|nr:NAD-dependent protein deacylase [Coriobacteriales bacterium]
MDTTQQPRQSREPQPLQQQLDRLAAIISASRNTVFFGGAGVSTPSGIPDFRSASGLYKARQKYGHSPEYLISHTAFVNDPELFFRYYKENLIYTDAQPNPAHLALAELERTGPCKAIVTQNVDGLHQAAGSRVVHELHGSVHRNHCMSCNAFYDLEYILNPAHCRNSAGRQTQIPFCENCGGVVKPDVVLYEEPLEHSTMRAAEAAVRAADTLIVGGTSLVVYPAAGYVDIFSGSNLVFINKGETDRDNRADLVIHEDIATVLGIFLRD